MDRTNGNTAAALNEAEVSRALTTWGSRASFFALLSTLERALGVSTLGTEARPTDERIRLRHDPALRFAAGDIADLRERDGTLEVRTTFLGLAGPVSTLPVFMLDEIAQEDPEHGVRRELVDVFHHRALSLLFRSVEQLRPGRTMRTDGDDLWSRRLVAASGAEASSLAMADRLRILPLLSTSRRSASGLLAALRILLHQRVGAALTIALRELRGAHVAIAGDARLRLGRSANALGRQTVLGARVADAGGACVLEIGGVDSSTHPRLLPGGDLHALVSEVFALFDPAALELVLELRVVAGSRGFGLGARTPLGRGSWLASTRPERTVRVDALVARGERAPAVG